MAGTMCAGCDKHFTKICGYLFHLDQTRNVLCMQVCDSIRCRRHRPCSVHRDSSSSSSGDSGSSSKSSTSSNSESLEKMQVFEGDMFGSATEYANDNFGQHEDIQPFNPPTAADDSTSEHVPNESDNSDREAEMVARLEEGWEAECKDAPECGPGPDPFDNKPLAGAHSEQDELEAEVTQEARQAESILIGEGHGIKPKVTICYSDAYPASQAGQPLSQQESTNACYTAALGSGDWAPFNSKLDWEIAHWAKCRGLGSTAFSNLLAIDGVSPSWHTRNPHSLIPSSIQVREGLNLLYKNSDELNQMIDSKLPGRPQFHCREVVIQGEAMELYCRDIMECLQALWGDPDFVGKMIFEPECQYADDDEVICLYHGMETGKWWWKIQVCCRVFNMIISADGSYKRKLNLPLVKQNARLFPSSSHQTKHSLHSFEIRVFTLSI